MKQIHEIQLNILQKLMYAELLSYSSLKPESMEGSKFVFHLDKLLKIEFIEKTFKGYRLTNKGKEFANRMDLGDSNVKYQAKISVILCCKRERSDGETDYLLYTRKKNPFYGFQGFPTGKVLRGEKVTDAAIRELKEETNLEGEPEIFAIRHYRIFTKTGELLEDKIFFAYKFDNPVGDLEGNMEGSYEWIKNSEVWDYLKKPVKEIQEIFEALENFQGNITFLEDSYQTAEF